MAADKVLADFEDLESNLSDLEKGLGTHLPDAATNAETLGEAYDVVWSHLQTFAGAGGRCPTAASFYLVRSEILRLCPSQKLTPSTRLTDIKGFVYLDLQAALDRASWSSPICFPRSAISMAASRIVPIGAGMLGGAMLMDAHSILGLPVFLGVPLIGPWIAHRYLFRKGVPAGCTTLGDLAVCVMRLNLRRLRARGATGLNRKMVWRLVTQGIGTTTGTANRAAILG